MRIRILVPVSRDAVVAALPKGWWRQAIPRFKPINICIAAVDGTMKQAESLAKSLVKLPLIGHLFTVTVDSVIVQAGAETADGESTPVPL